MLSLSHALIQHRQRDLLRRQGFTLVQTAVLISYRANYRTGRFAYDTPTNQHLTFARWLYQHGKISG